MFSTRAKDCENVAPIILNGDSLPWVTRAKHLGNILECSNRMKQDCDMKRGKFVGKINTLSQELHLVDPNVKVKILNIYATSFYVSGLWDIYGYDCNRFFTAWNSAIRQIFTLPWTYKSMDNPQVLDRANL